MRRRSAASESHSKARVAFASSERRKRKTRSAIGRANAAPPPGRKPPSVAAPPAALAAADHAPLEEQTTMSTSDATARNARVPSRRILGLSQRSHARTNAPFGLLAARRRRSPKPVARRFRWPPNQ